MWGEAFSRDSSQALHVGKVAPTVHIAKQEHTRKKDDLPPWSLDSEPG